MLANCLSSTLLTVPLAVAKKTKGGSAALLSSNDSSSNKLSSDELSSLVIERVLFADSSSTNFGMGKIVVTDSSPVRPIKLTSGRPRAPRLAMGTSKPRRLKTLPVSVKQSTVA